MNRLKGPLAWSLAGIALVYVLVAAAIGANRLIPGTASTGIGPRVLRPLALTLTAFTVGLAVALVSAVARPTAEISAAPNLSTEEQAFATLINDYRQVNGLGRLAIDWEMQSSSDWMSNDMSVGAYFSHTDSLGRDPWARMCAFDYAYNTWMGENLAVGYSTAGDVFAAWKDSPGHNANMLHTSFVAMGISALYVPGSPYGWYWTNDFGGVESDASSPSGSGTGTTVTEGR